MTEKIVLERRVSKAGPVMAEVESFAAEFDPPRS
jgi:hypothetical protein